MENRRDFGNLDCPWPQTSESLNGEFDAGHDEKFEQNALARQPHSGRHNNQQHFTRQAMQEKPEERERGKREKDEGRKKT